MSSETHAEGPDQSETTRRREILLAAIELFRERGYHATGMNDIGEAVGMTGPALYRHFAGKEDILETALLNAARYMERKVDQVVAESLDPRETLGLLIRDLARIVTDYPAVVSIALSERRHMSDRARAIYDRSTRLRETEWVGPLLELRPDLPEVEARLRVRIAQNLVGSSVVGGTQLTAGDRVDLLASAALTILLDEATRELPQESAEDPIEIDDVA